MNSLEKELIEDITNGKNINLERSLLIVSGLSSEKTIEEYQDKILHIHDGFVTRLRAKSPETFEIPKQYTVYDRSLRLFEYFWNTKPRRCNSNFLFTDVIDAQLDPDPHRTVGSCIGLTSLYTVIGLREGLDLSIFSNGNHILNRLCVEGRYIIIENTDPLGFDYNGIDESFEEYKNHILLAHMFNSRGVLLEKENKLEEAARDYEKAILIKPRYANAINNLGNIRFKQKHYTEALRSYNKALSTNPEFTEAYCNRGIVLKILEDYTGAMRDFKKTLEIDPEYKDALNWLAVLGGKI